MLEPGSPAPAFRLPDQDGRLVSLYELRGRWIVLYFYPKDDTPGCTIEACEFTKSLPEFRGLDAEVFGCSADDAPSHQQFVAKYQLGIRLLTDADRTVMKSYGAFGKKMLYGNEVEGVIRSTVLIAPDGSIAHRWATVKAEGHAEQVRAKLAELQGGAGPLFAAREKPVGRPPAASPAQPAARPAKAPAKAAAKASAKPARKPASKAPGKVAGKAAKPARKSGKVAAKSAGKAGRKSNGKAKGNTKGKAKKSRS